MKLEVNYKRVVLFSIAAKAFIEKNKDKETKLLSSLKSVQKQIQKEEILEGYNEALSELELTHCSTDANGNILKSEGGQALCFTPEKRIALNKASKALFVESRVVLHARILPENDAEVKNLTEAEIEAFGGIVLTEVAE